MWMRPTLVFNMLMLIIIIITMYLNQNAPIQHSHPRRLSELFSSCKKWGNPYSCTARPAYNQLCVRSEEIQLTWCKDPWQRWHCVHNLEKRTWSSDELVTCFWYSSPNRGRQLLHTAPSTTFMRRGGCDGIDYALLILLLARKGVLQPMHVTVFTANFMSPPTVGVAIWMLLVWPPDTVVHNQIG